MKYEIIFLAILIMSASSYALDQQKIYFISMEYNNGSLILLDVSLTEGFPSVNKNPDMSNRAELVSFDGKILYEGYFDIPNFVYVPPPIDSSDNTESIFIERVNFSISLPFDKNATKINIYGSENEIILSVDVSSFADYCGDKRCSTIENKDICPNDCVMVGIGNDIIFYLEITVVAIAILLAFIYIKK